MSLSITAVRETTSPPRMLVTVTATGGSGASAALDVYRVHEDGRKYRLITPDRPVIAGGVWAGFDTHAPYNQTVTYRAESGSEFAVSGVVVQLSQWAWLLHPEDSALSVLVDRDMVHLGPLGDPGYDSRATLHEIVDSGDVISLGDGRRAGEKRDLTVICRSDTALSAVRDLLESDAPVLINTPYERNDVGWLWVQPTSVVVENPGHRPNATRLVKLSYQRVAQPDVDSLAEWTCDDLAATGWTCDQAAAQYVDCTAMSLDRRVA